MLQPTPPEQAASADSSSLNHFGEQQEMEIALDIAADTRSDSLVSFLSTNTKDKDPLDYSETSSRMTVSSYASESNRSQRSGVPRGNDIGPKHKESSDSLTSSNRSGSRTSHNHLADRLEEVIGPSTAGLAGGVEWSGAPVAGGREAIGLPPPPPPLASSSPSRQVKIDADLHAIVARGASPKAEPLAAGLGIGGAPPGSVERAGAPQDEATHAVPHDGGGRGGGEGRGVGEGSPGGSATKAVAAASERSCAPWLQLCQGEEAGGACTGSASPRIRMSL